MGPLRRGCDEHCDSSPSTYKYVVGRLPGTIDDVSSLLLPPRAFRLVPSSPHWLACFRAFHSPSCAFHLEGITRSLFPSAEGHPDHASYASRSFLFFLFCPRRWHRISVAPSSSPLCSDTAPDVQNCRPSDPNRLVLRVGGALC